MTTTLTALLIEDNPGDAALIRYALAGPDAGASAAPDFHLVCMDRLASGLLRLDDEGVDIVLLDLSLPDSQGLESVSQVRARSPHVPIVVLTGLDDEAMGLKAVREGAQDYLIKGNLDGALLKRAMRYAIERRRFSEERERLYRELQEAMVRIKVLQGILPICSLCKQIRDAKGDWQPVEVYVKKHSDADFSHGICPACLDKHYPMFKDGEKPGPD
jgi:sigma-B regulation protein RsbU (phosphoserine phosphatase)